MNQTTPQQTDLLRDSPQSEAERNRICAQVALVDPHWTPEQRKARHEHYMRLAEQATNN
jgi:hypothetical protein